MSIRVDVFSGFLGAGKTTLIKKIIDENFSREKVVIIENEFGEVGIDGSILRKLNMEIKEINAGCICCTINDDFKQALQNVIKEFNPDRIIIEPSGVGKLSEILKVLNDSHIKNNIILDMVITVVDALKYKVYVSNFDEFYKNQLINSNTIILSRTQEADNKLILEVTSHINKLNAKASIITTPWDQISSMKIIETAQHNIKFSSAERASLIKSPGDLSFSKFNINSNHNHSADESFSTWGTETAKIFNEKSLIDNLHNINKSSRYGTILRAKGIVQVDKNKWVQFDYVPGEIKVVNTDPDYTGRICIIGKDLNKNAVKDLFLK